MAPLVPLNNSVVAKLLCCRGGFLRQGLAGKDAVRHPILRSLEVSMVTELKLSSEHIVFQVPPLILLVNLNEE